MGGELLVLGRAPARGGQAGRAAVIAAIQRIETEEGPVAAAALGRPKRAAGARAVT